MGYGGGKAVRPVERTKELISLKYEIKKEVQSETVSIDVPRNYQLENCDKYKYQEEVLIYINNDSLKKEHILNNYVLSINKRLQKIFPYDKNCYDSVVIQTQYFDKAMDSTINKRYSFPMIK
ncbi:hypothetical protein NG800_005990 [Epilithonimonas ginsengisoli]|uniref:Uncharacterized protein n=1 Tax=Epilithonimonas ginsengisoli TaxID=1245592 RepID=A0ABU4JFJ5_9FLAO|nr:MULTISPECIES: hypothetical protein [Chryseobacterium group]MBV6879810.1 hypothetical protein [Epilithonimonas sp. FP105]MDW8548450.1 hypothetical protein [Epilithonimonas ginsengisoli]OAH75757.1 hypothetical protein AXA65_02770 [Chryseobacterium sp. FP211-J200]